MGWQLEIAKMAMYLAFPVTMFYYFNQPQLFEEWVVQTKREIFPPENEEQRKQFRDTFRYIQNKNAGFGANAEQ
ncbi:protein PET100 homolog, mitochondrial [Cylas formicarius]|uniref:protein PET100 homolog, mitochondrial n=1 Tax=Cylas formicarius TaxID=197179 RepID=UPI002958D835|nr:protein PET100 homolog, mitochondrial [Cylas formicarius]XP_060523964.1 protein PET100 homolog, mitochondrial [Cylas formicarius]